MKTNRPLKGDGEWRKHRSKWLKRRYWKRERRAHHRAILSQLEG